MKIEINKMKNIENYKMIMIINKINIKLKKIVRISNRIRKFKLDKIKNKKNKINNK